MGRSHDQTESPGLGPPGLTPTAHLWLVEPTSPLLMPLMATIRALGLEQDSGVGDSFRMDPGRLIELGIISSASS